MADNNENNTPVIPTNQDPQSVSPDLVRVPVRETDNPDIQVKLEVPHTDLAGIRADDPPAVAQQKIDAAHEKIRELMADAGQKTVKEVEKEQTFDPESTDGAKNPYASAGTNKEADGPATVSEPGAGN